MSQARQVLVFAGFALATACGGGGDGTDPGPQLPRLLYNDPSSGNSQTDTVGATLPVQLSVKVLDSTNTAVQNHAITWTVPVGQGSVSSPTTNTNASGVASVTRTLGTTAGTQTAQAAASGVTGSPKAFTTTATAGVATQLAKTAGDGGSAVINGQVTYTVTARDGHNNPKQGVTIDWAATGGGGSINPLRNTTGTSGTASATRTLSGTQGAHTATATANGIPGAPSETFTTNAIVAPTSADVSLQGIQFVPDSVLIAATGSVTWTWNDGATVHNVTFTTAGAPTGCDNAASGTCARPFPTAGTFEYHCTQPGHANMTGKVVVVP
jgi:adhesin/invasin